VEVHSNVASERDGNAVGKEIGMDTGSESNRIRGERSARDGRPNTNGHGAVESASERTPGSTDQPGTEVREDRIVVGIPTYNEEVAIGSVVAASEKYADDVIVVDDGSTDRTTEIAWDVGATVIRHEVNNVHRMCPGVRKCRENDTDQPGANTIEVTSAWRKNV
jgi:hypothetical protein